MTAAPQAEMHARITPEKVAAMKERIGTTRPKRAPWGPFNREAHPDSIRHFAYGIGDNNPLWCEPEYGAQTRWSSVIAPPLYIRTLSEEETRDDMPRAPKGDPLRGLHAFLSIVDWEFYRPIFPGDRAKALAYTESVEEKHSTFGGGKSVKVTHAFRYKNQRGDVVAVSHEGFFHTERDSAAKAGKNAAITRQVYTPEEMREIDEAYENEQRRGAEPRYWEDVQPGDVIPPIVKGPFTMVDLIGNNVGSSFGAFGVTPFRIGYLNRKRVSGFYFPDDYGVPISAWACHYDESVAKRAGAPLPYDYGGMRESWLLNLLTNWIGDDGFVHRTHAEFRRFNYFGDTQWCRGNVTGKEQRGDLNVVTIEMSCTNQRGEVTTLGSADILLPSRERGPVKLPFPPRDLP